MSHTFTHDDTAFHHNSDMSGDVIIDTDWTGGAIRIAVPGVALLAFFQHLLIGAAVEKLESLGDDEPTLENILKIPR